jgi:hypothetical protein
MSQLHHRFVLSRLSVNMGECLHNKLQAHLNLMKKLQWPVAGGSSATDAKIVPSRHSKANIATAAVRKTVQRETYRCIRREHEGKEISCLFV